MTDATHLEILGEAGNGAESVLTLQARAFLVNLHRRFDARRRELLAARKLRQRALEAGELPTFLPHTRSIRAGAWTTAPVPADLSRRLVEITGPTDAKMVINAMNSGADVFMADFEDANSPTWRNMLQGQVNLQAAVQRRLAFTSADGRHYELSPQPAMLMVRPRGWHLDERHVAVDAAPVAGSLFDFGLFALHNAHALLARGSGPYFYLPKLENHLEARLWADVFAFAEEALRLPPGAIKCTVLIETILAAFEMDEILFELRERITGLNAGRWDYIFSIIKKFRTRSNAVLPDRSQITMAVPFMRAYTDLLVKTCHKRGAYAMGGMAAFVPSRRDHAVNETAMARVREDKQREVRDGCDGTWVAHPDLVPVAREVFEDGLDGRPNQLHRLRQDVAVAEPDLLNFAVADGRITEGGVRNNISVAVQYLAAWLSGQGAVAINNLMEDTATAEIARAQVWQWLHHGATLEDGLPLTMERYSGLLDNEMERLSRQISRDANEPRSFGQAAELFDDLATDEQFAEFLTVAAQQRLQERETIAV